MTETLMCYECIKKATVKATPDTNSELLGFLMPGDMIEVLAVDTAPKTGRTRFQCRPLSQPGGTCSKPELKGWVSLEAGSMDRLFRRLDVCPPCIAICIIAHLMNLFSSPSLHCLRYFRDNCSMRSKDEIDGGEIVIRTTKVKKSTSGAHVSSNICVVC